MSLENQFYYGVWLLPPMVILLTACSKNKIAFLIGLLTSIFISYSLYVNYMYVPFLLESQTLPLPAEWFDTHRSFVVMDVIFYGTFKILLYSLFVGVIFWNICLIKSKNSINFRDFSKTSSFYFILFVGTMGNLILSSYCTYCHLFPLSMFLFIPFLFIALIKHYPSKGKVKWNFPCSITPVVECI